MFVLAASDIAGALVFAAIGMLMILFPRAFIGLKDVNAALKGYAPIKDHFMRSPLTYRLMGALCIFCLDHVAHFLDESGAIRPLPPAQVPVDHVIRAFWIMSLVATSPGLPQKLAIRHNAHEERRG